MIKLNRVRKPAYFFNSSYIRELKREIFSYFEMEIGRRDQVKFPVERLTSVLNEIKEDILAKTNGKCAYCDSKLHETSYIDIDHFRPKTNAANTNGEISPDHYWWLSLEWNNIYPICVSCKKSKANFFPVRGERVRNFQVSKSVLFESEVPLFIDPGWENPEEHFYYDLDSGEIIPNNERSKVTIDLLFLNRTELRERRIQSMYEIRDKLRRFEEEMHYSIKEERLTPNALDMIRDFETYFTTSDEEYLGSKRWIIRDFFPQFGGRELNLLPPSFRKHLRIRKRLERRGLEPRGGFGGFPYRRFEIDSIRISNYRSINNLELRFDNEGEHAGWIMLIGENGVGKSSTLTAVLKTLLRRDYRAIKFDPSEVRKNQEEDGRIEIRFTSENLSAEAQISENRTVYNFPKGTFINEPILAFSPFKHIHKEDVGSRDFVGGAFVDNFFRPSICLHSPEKFLLTLEERQFRTAAIAILDLLMLEGRARIHRNTWQEIIWFEFENERDDRSFDELSDGFKSVITLGCNIMEGLLRNNEDFSKARGLVVIDEIGANLHPRWKMQIIKRLRRAFPYVQFLVTTHDPLCLKGIEKGEVYVLRSHEGETEVIRDLPNPSHLRADQLLTSEFFGLYSTQDPETERLFEQYYDLLSMDPVKRPGDYNLELRILKDKLKEREFLGNSLREELYYDVVDTVIARRKDQQNFNRESVKKEVKEEALKMINNLLDKLE